MILCESDLLDTINISRSTMLLASCTTSSTIPMCDMSSIMYFKTNEDQVYSSGCGNCGVWETALSRANNGAFRWALKRTYTLLHLEIVRKGYISKMMPEYHEEIEICDKLRECLLMEVSDSYCIFNEAQRKELLLRLFQLLVVGGSFNQYEDIIQPYLDWTKKIYKSLVSVRKRA